MASDRWTSYVQIVTDGTISPEDFVFSQKPKSGNDFISATRVLSGEKVMYSLSRSSRKDDGHIQAVIVDNADRWGVVIDASGRFPRYLGRDVISAIGLDYETYGEHVRVLSNTGIELSSDSIPLEDGGLDGWVKSGMGMVVVATSRGREITPQQRNRFVPDFYAHMIPFIESPMPESDRVMEEATGIRFKPNTITALVRLHDGGVVVAGSIPLDSKDSGRRFSRVLRNGSMMVSKEMESLFEAGRSILMYGDAEVPESTDADDGEKDELRRRIAELESQNTSLSQANRALSKENHSLLSQTAQEDTPEEPSSDVVPDAPESVESVVSASRKITEREHGAFFDTFAAIEQKVSDLDFVRVVPGAFSDVDDIESAPQSNSWRTSTWNAILALNEYGESLSDGSFQGNFYEYLRSHPSPPISRKRVALRESDTVRTNPKFMLHRTFPIDGKPVPMESHFKIDASGRHPSPRMHFIERNGIIYIGYVGRHLPTFRTN